MLALPFVENGAVERVEIAYQGLPTGLSLNDAGTGGDFLAGDGVWGWGAEFLQPLEAPPGRFLLELVTFNTQEEAGSPWPWLTVE